MRNLFEISIAYSDSNKFATLASSNFSNLSAIQILHFYDCAIEIIDDDTFDIIGKTLLRLTLYRTRLKTIHLVCFQSYFEHSHLAMGAITAILGDPLACDCEYCLLKNASTIAYSKWIRRPLQYFDCMGNFNSIDCPDMQRLIPQKICLHNLWLDKSAYIRFHIKKENNSISIRTNASLSYKILVELNGMAFRQICPDHLWLQTNVKCTKMHQNAPNESRYSEIVNSTQEKREN